MAAHLLSNLLDNAFDFLIIMPLSHHPAGLHMDWVGEAGVLLLAWIYQE